MNTSRIRQFIIWATMGTLISPSTLFAQMQPTSNSTTEMEENAFDPNLILQDDDIFDVTAMSRDRIQSFLMEKGALGSYQTTDIDGITKSAADIIFRVANSYKINPKYLLVLLQKEQSLVESKTLSQKALDWATGYGVCDDCKKDDPSIQAFKGFANQLEYAAKQHRERYLMQILIRGKTIAGHAPGKTITVSGMKVTPANNATAMLYSYTPHIHGNLVLWKIWRRWFSLQYPEGSVIFVKESNKYYLIRYGQKRQIKNRAVVASFTDPNKVILGSESVLSGYEIGKAISYPNYSIVQTEKDKLYLITGEKKRLFITKKVFQKLGFVEDDILEGTEAEMASYTDGPDITEKSTAPLGSLVRDPQKKIWYTEDGVKQAIPDPIYIKLYFNQRPIRSITKEKLEALKTGEPIGLRDGELVKSNAKGENSVYVIENGKKRPIPSGQIFEELGWQWKNVLSVPKKLIDAYPTGTNVNPYFVLPEPTPTPSESTETMPQPIPTIDPLDEIELIRSNQEASAPNNSSSTISGAF